MLDNLLYFTVTDLKQHAFCARVVYYERCLPHIRPHTVKMDVGHQAHEEEQKRAIRRTLSQYEEQGGERQFQVHLTSDDLGLTGELDELVMTTDGRVIPVDYKFAKQVRSNHRIQLAAYAMLVESCWQTHVDYGYIYLIPHRETVKVVINERLRNSVSMTLNDLHHMVATETMPPPITKPNQCMNCEFRRFCNDV